MQNPYFTYQRVCLNSFKTSANILCLLMTVTFTHNLSAQTFSKIRLNNIDAKNSVSEYRAMVCINQSSQLCCEFHSKTHSILLNPIQCTKKFDLISAQKPLKISYISILNSHGEASYFYPNSRDTLSALDEVVKVNLLFTQ